MRILWVKAGGLLPLDRGGKIRSYHILRQLARLYPVTYFGFYGQQKDDAHIQLKNLVENLVLVPMRLPSPKGPAEFWQYGKQLFSSQPYVIHKYCRPEAGEQLRHLLARESFDIMVCDFLASAGVIPWDWPGTKVLFTHNVEALIWQRYYQVARNPIRKLLSYREWQVTRHAERAYLSKADHVLAVSDADKHSFQEFLSPAKLSVVPTGVDIDYFRPASASGRSNSIVFTGSMDYLPNEDGVVYFIREILPLIRQRIPDVHFTVVGRWPSRRLQALAAGQPSIQLTGLVPDIRPYLEQAAVCVVPLRVGSGTRLKIFEAMSMCKAVVSTTLGAEGLAVEHDKNILLADAPADFASSVVDLLQNKARRERLAEAGRNMVEADYSWTAVAKEFARTLMHAVSCSASMAAV